MGKLATNFQSAVRTTTTPKATLITLAKPATNFHITIPPSSIPAKKQDVAIFGDSLYQLPIQLNRLMP